MRSHPEQSCERTGLMDRRTALITGGLGALGITSAALWYRHRMEACTVLPPPEKDPPKEDDFGRRVLATFETTHESKTIVSKFVDDGLTIYMKGETEKKEEPWKREFRIEKVVDIPRKKEGQEPEKFVTTAKLLETIGAAGIYQIRQEAADMMRFFTEKNGNVTIPKTDILRILEDLRIANKNFQPITLAGIAYSLRAKIKDLLPVWMDGNCTLHLQERRVPEIGPIA